LDEPLLDRCQQIIGYQFRDLSLLEQALTHASVAANRLASNERLEFLGDAVLGLVVCQELYERHADLLEGEMTKIKSTVVSRRTCAEVVEEASLAGVVILGKGMPSAEKLPPSVMAGVFESIVAAVYLDGGLGPARACILQWMVPHIEEALATEHQRNYKSLLQQHAQRRWGQTPEYHLLDEKGPDHSKCFEVSVSLRGRHYPSAWGMNKKEAEQAAALNALRELDLLGKEGPPATDAGEQDENRDAPA